jgi:acyl carrier protein
MQQPEAIENDEQNALDGSALQREIAAAADETEREAILREAVRSQTATILDLTVVEDDSNFLEQGLTSLKALELTRNLMTLTNVEVPLVAVIEYPTPSQLAKYMVEAMNDAG